jgi:hypothetical protein
MDLFWATTKIAIGNGESTSFWSELWTECGPIRLWAPDLYKVASRKGRYVAKEMYNDNWIRSITRLSTSIQLDQYLQVWEVVAGMRLTPTMSDTITWKLNPEGVYSASSAYHMQFLGCFPKFDAKKICSAHAEPKCKIFAWLALHRKLLTTDILAIRGWPHDPVCPLCLSALETTTHLCKECPFTSAIWTHIQQDHTDGPVTHDKPSGPSPIGGTRSSSGSQRIPSVAFVDVLYMSSGMPGRKETDAFSRVAASYSLRWLLLQGKTSCKVIMRLMSPGRISRPSRIRVSPFVFALWFLACFHFHPNMPP